MKSFAIDVYLWHAISESWLFVPPSSSSLLWKPKLSVSEILSSLAGVSFRVDHNLWLGNERDAFPLDLLCYELSNTILKSTVTDQMYFADLKVSENLNLQLNVNNDSVWISRYNTRKATDYFEEVAHIVGSYYRNYQIPKKLWVKAVKSSLGGLTKILTLSQSLDEFEEIDSKFGQWLISNYSDT